MFIRFVPPTLDSLDSVETEVLLISVFSEDGPLKGVAGLVDWRLCGRLSEWILEEQLTGKEGEKLIMPARPRLRAERILLFGLGPEESFGEAQFRGYARRVARTLEAARLSSVALELPTGAASPLDAEKRMRILLEAIGEDELLDELVLIEPPECHRALHDVVERVRRRTKAGMS